MEEVHKQNAERLRQIVAEHGWPTRTLVGEKGAEAAWLIVQHAIGEPDCQRGMLRLLKDAASRGDIPPYQPAYLEDRICTSEGRPQVYGTQFMPGEDGLPVPSTIGDVEHVNERRAAIGLDTIEERTEHFRRTAKPEERPKNMQAYQRGYEEWQRKVGWRK